MLRVQKLNRDLIFNPSNTRNVFFFMNIEVTTFWFKYEKVSSKPHSSLSY